MAKDIPKRIISGGQTGADRAALDAALENNIAIGGFVPKGRIAEDGIIDKKYTGHVETESDDPAERTKLNVSHTDATILFSHGGPKGGSLLTLEIATQIEKPILQIDLNIAGPSAAAAVIEKWLRGKSYETLNIAGSRASEDREVYSKVFRTLDLFLCKEKEAAE